MLVLHAALRHCERGAGLAGWNVIHLPYHITEGGTNGQNIASFLYVTQKPTHLTRQKKMRLPQQLSSDSISALSAQTCLLCKSAEKEKMAICLDFLVLQGKIAVTTDKSALSRDPFRNRLSLILTLELLESEV